MRRLLRHGEIEDDPVVRAVNMLALATLTLFLLVFGFATWVWVDSSEQEHEIRAAAVENCQAINHNNRIIRTQLIRSRVALPKITYYRQHPDELANQVLRINQQLDDFRERDCP